MNFLRFDIAMLQFSVSEEEACDDFSGRSISILAIVTRPRPVSFVFSTLQICNPEGDRHHVLFDCAVSSEVWQCIGLAGLDDVDLWAVGCTNNPSCFLAVSTPHPALPTLGC